MATAAMQGLVSNLFKAGLCAGSILLLFLYMTSVSEVFPGHRLSDKLISSGQKFQFEAAHPSFPHIRPHAGMKRAYRAFTEGQLASSPASDSQSPHCRMYQSAHRQSFEAWSVDIEGPPRCNEGKPRGCLPGHWRGEWRC